MIEFSKIIPNKTYTVGADKITFIPYANGSSVYAANIVFEHSDDGIECVNYMNIGSQKDVNELLSGLRLRQKYINNNLSETADEDDIKRAEKDEYDPVKNPAHYTAGGIDCIDAMQAAFGKNEVMSFCKLNAFKYIWRAGKKNVACDSALQDAQKAHWYLEKYISLSSNPR